MDPDPLLDSGNGRPDLPASIEEAAAIVRDAFQREREAAHARQPAIPGLTPPFDFKAALDSIEQQEQAASRAEREYVSASEHAKQRRKEADTENAKLRTLIRELNERRHDARYEGSGEDQEHAHADAVPTVPVLGDLDAEPPAPAATKELDPYAVVYYPRGETVEPPRDEPERARTGPRRHTAVPQGKRSGKREYVKGGQRGGKAPKGKSRG
jgi:hypothetical protein